MKRKTLINYKMKKRSKNYKPWKWNKKTLLKLIKYNKNVKLICNAFFAKTHKKENRIFWVILSTITSIPKRYYRLTALLWSLPLAVTQPIKNVLLSLIRTNLEYGTPAFSVSQLQIFFFLSRLLNLMKRLALTRYLTS